MKKATLLLLEDDPTLHDILTEFLEEADFEVLGAIESQEAADLAYESPCDLLLLDVKVPGQNGFDLLKSLRQQGVSAPAIFLTSLNDVADLSLGFEAGCDDYLRKPFELQELLIRIEALLKRRFYHRSEAGVALCEGVRFFPESNRLESDEGPVTLPPKEYALLKLLIEHRGRVVPKELVTDRLWGLGEEPSEMSLRTHLKNLRKLIGKERIETVRGVGYRLASE
jgi:DNA-binding response OmpR family regulator